MVEVKSRERSLPLPLSLRDLSKKLPKRYPMRSHINWGGERNILYKGVETSPQQTCFKNLEGKPERESPKRTISASGGLGLLHILCQTLTPLYIPYLSALLTNTLELCTNYDIILHVSPFPRLPAYTSVIGAYQYIK